jgi:hypothetical protein
LSIHSLNFSEKLPVRVSLCWITKERMKDDHATSQLCWNRLRFIKVFNITKFKLKLSYIMNLLTWASEFDIFIFWIKKKKSLYFSLTHFCNFWTIVSPEYLFYFLFLLFEKSRQCGRGSLIFPEKTWKCATRRGKSSEIPR